MKKAMILAAGMGTRLKPITDKIPKALVEINGVPVLERIIFNLKKSGFNIIVINVHHFASKIKDFLNQKDFGIPILVSDESDCLLDTGGGIVKAFPLLFGEDENPVLFHNVDIISNANLNQVVNNMAMTSSDGTLLVSQRKSSRKILFDNDDNLIGWHDLNKDIYKPTGIERLLKSDSDITKEKLQNEIKELAFSGIYSLSANAVEEMRKLMGKGKYSIMDYFLHPSRVSIIKGLEQKNLELLDIGKPATLEQAPVFLKKFNNFN